MVSPGCGYISFHGRYILSVLLRSEQPDTVQNVMESLQSKTQILSYMEWRSGNETRCSTVAGIEDMVFATTLPEGVKVWFTIVCYKKLFSNWHSFDRLLPLKRSWKSVESRNFVQKGLNDIADDAS